MQAKETLQEGRHQREAVQERRRSAQRCRSLEVLGSDIDEDDMKVETSDRIHQGIATMVEPMHQVRVQPPPEEPVEEGPASKKPRPDWQAHASAFCQGGQIDLKEVCRAPSSDLCVPDYTVVWNHKIVQKKRFVSEWLASSRALDMAFEVGELYRGQAAPVTAAPRRLAERRIRFSNDVDLYVGSETDIVMAKW